MKGVSPSCSKTDSPKTPGGISKSLLTPCRRVGLSRKWKKGGGSPFISPLSTHNSTPETKESRDTKKRKKCDESESDFCVVDNETPNNQLNVIESSPGVYQNFSMTNSITTTPCRNTQISRTKSKTLSLTLNRSQENKYDSNSQECNIGDSSNQEHTTRVIESKENADVVKENKKNTKIYNTDPAEEKDLNPTKQTSQEHVAKIVKSESKSKSKLSLKKSNSKSNSNTENQNNRIISENSKMNVKIPNNLTNKCIVVIQNKIFKPDSTNAKSSKVIQEESDSEPEIPLSELKKESTENVTLNTLNDDDFVCKPPKKKFRKLSIIRPADRIESSQSSQEEGKRTIVIKKTYEKVKKPLKAKSTGSITQKDIDDMKARIEMKKKLLMAKAMSTDTEELRELIKKWQKGCQDALMELLDLMKKKLPDRQNMDYAEILETLKIPAELVGYDSENDCFLTPDDNTIILSALKL